MGEVPKRSACRATRWRGSVATRSLSHIRLLPACAVVGAIFMVLADIASRALVSQQVLPIGVVTALVGVPFFSVILYRFQRPS